mgnify:CR=1 FL=1
MEMLLAIGMGVGIGSQFGLGCRLVSCWLGVMMTHACLFAGMVIFASDVMLACPSRLASMMTFSC